MRELDTHKLPGLNDHIQIIVRDEPGCGGANHEYCVVLRAPMDPGDSFQRVIATWPIEFQKGPIKEAGLNGLSNEALLAIVIDRLRGFQRGEFSTKENSVALTHLETALLWMQARTMDRIKRGVEGKLEK